jgi:hypothetical protein
MSFNSWRLDEQGREYTYAVYVRIGDGAYQKVRGENDIANFDDALEWFDYETDMAVHAVSSGAVKCLIVVELLRDGNDIITSAAITPRHDTVVRQEVKLSSPVSQPRKPFVSSRAALPKKERA